MDNPKDNITIGIDGGGTGCRVAIATAQGQRLGHARGGPANPSQNPEVATANILQTIEAARLDAGLDESAINTATAFLGLAGIRSEKTANRIAAALPVKFARVVEDRVTTVTGALAGGDGAVAAIGTGSFVACSKQGQTQYVGGWGFLLGDQASGAWLGHQLMCRIALCIENLAPHSPLTRAVFTQFGDDGERFFDFSTTATPAEFGEFAPQILDHATAGDETANTLLQEGAGYIETALSSLGFHTGFPLCLTGGLGPHYAKFLPKDLTTNLMAPKGSALDGAVLLATQLEANR